MSDAPPNLQLPPYINATAQLSELKATSFGFLLNVKTRLGEHSSRRNHIHKTLGAFKKGELSKRDTHTSIVKTLDGYDDLKRELMDLLMLPAAEWHSDDFDLPMQQQPTMSFVGSTPEFLQPAHEPQMRLPSLSSNWLTVPQAEQSAGHVTSKDYNDPTTSFPIPPDFTPSYTFQPPTLPWMNHNTSTLHPTPSDEANLPPHTHTTFRDPWQTPKFTNTWPDGGLNFSPDSMNVRKHFGPETSLGASYDHQQELPLVYPRNSELYQNLDSCQQMTVSPERTYSLMPSPTECSPTDKFPTTDDNLNSVSTKKERGMGAHALHAPVLKSPPHTQLVQDMDSSGHGFVAEPFIHSLCGKGFSTLSGVKKHHWGKKVNDITTKTGCWAKHNKPDVDWDDHPSCQTDRPIAKTTRSVAAVSAKSRSTTSTVKSEGSPALHVSHLNTIPGFPTLHDLPRTVAHAINVPAASKSGLVERAPPEHIYGTPSRSSFDELLTAVNVVSQIDAPKPRARTDSIALHLDAQVAATEQQSPLVPYRQSADSVLSYRVRPDAPPGIYPALQRPTPGVASERTWSMNSENPSVKSWPKAVESSINPAVSRPFRTLQVQSSDPAKKKRRI